MIALLNPWLRSGLNEEQEYDEMEGAESLAGIQGQGGDSCREGRQGAGRTGSAIRCSSQLDRRLEDAIAGALCRRVRRETSEGFRVGYPDNAGQDWSADAGKRFLEKVLIMHALMSAIRCPEGNPLGG